MPPAISPHSSARVDLLEQHSGYWKPEVETERIQIVTEQTNELLAADLLQNQRDQRSTLQSPTWGYAPPGGRRLPPIVAPDERCAAIIRPAGLMNFAPKSRTRDIALQNPNGV